VDDFAGVSGEGTEESTVTVHDDETETGVRLKELGERLGVELVVAEIEGGVDGLWRGKSERRGDRGESGREGAP
jgi:hypothetical protein